MESRHVPNKRSTAATAARAASEAATFWTPQFATSASLPAFNFNDSKNCFRGRTLHRLNHEFLALKWGTRIYHVCLLMHFPKAEADSLHLDRCCRRRKVLHPPSLRVLIRLTRTHETATCRADQQTVRLTFFLLLAL